MLQSQKNGYGSHCSEESFQPMHVGIISENSQSCTQRETNRMMHKRSKQIIKRYQFIPCVHWNWSTNNHSIDEGNLTGDRKTTSQPQLAQNTILSPTPEQSNWGCQGKNSFMFRGLRKLIFRKSTKMKNKIT